MFTNDQMIMNPSMQQQMQVPPQGMTEADMQKMRLLQAMQAQQKNQPSNTTSSGTTANMLSSVLNAYMQMNGGK